MSELDTLAATLKQLENQKGEAQKRLNDLRAQVDKLRAQAAEQAEAVAAQEAELNSKKEQLEGLKQEEQRLEQQRNESQSKLQSLTTNLQDTQLNISQAKALITQLQEQTRQMNDAIEACDIAIETGDVGTVADTQLRIKPDFRDPVYTKVGLVNGNSNKQNGFGDLKDDPFSSNRNDTINTSSGFGEDLFNNDNFKNSDAFEPSDPFNSAFTKSNDGFSSDPFGGSSFNPGTTTKTDPFDAFGDSRKSVDATVEVDKDPFGCDPFAVLHAPTRDGAAPPRPTSPSPALPPKKSKQPPPRPAPPRPAQPPHMKRAPQSDLFGSGNDAFSSGGGFADFSDFDSKCLHYSSLKECTTSSPQNPSQDPFFLISFSTKPTDKVTAAQPKGLDFTDDPFRDYRYEDPFNIKFDDDEPNEETDSFGFSKMENLEKFDPFGLDGRQSVPLPGSDPFVSSASSGRSSAPIATGHLSEDFQLAWAARESLKLEEDRKKRQLKEQADLELAINLSKAESKKS